jgi:hypothetical protein
MKHFYSLACPLDLDLGEVALKVSSVQRQRRIRVNHIYSYHSLNSMWAEGFFVALQERAGWGFQLPRLVPSFAWLPALQPSPTVPALPPVRTCGLDTSELSPSIPTPTTSPSKPAGPPTYPVTRFQVCTGRTWEIAHAIFQFVFVPDRSFLN